MFAYHFTEDVRRALAAARAEADRLGHHYVGTEHLALGVLRTTSGTVATILGALDVAAVTAEIERLAGPGTRTEIPGADLPYTSRGKRALELAMREALELGHDAVDVGHLLLGLLREEKGIGAQVLRRAGLDLEATRAAVARDTSHGRQGRRGSRLNRLLLRLLEWAGQVPRG